MSAFAVSLVALSSTAFSAESPKFTVTKYNLTGYTDASYIKPEVREQLVLLLKEYTGQDVTVEKLYELKSRLQQVLNTSAKGVFTVNLPRQTIANGTVEFNVNFVAGKVVYNTAPGYDEANLKRSIPSLYEGVTFIGGRPWIDERELTMAVENPLKLTQVEYELQPGKPITANVNVVAPRGKVLKLVSVDNKGSQPYGYLRLGLVYLNANLTNRDDVLTGAVYTNFRAPQLYSVAGLTYSLPFYQAHQRLDTSVFYVSQRSFIPAQDDNKNLRFSIYGNGLIASVNWQYYLPHYDWSYSNQLKLVAGYTFKRTQDESALHNQETNSGPGVQSGQPQVAQESRTALRNLHYYTSPFKLGLSGKVIPYRGLDVDFNFAYNFYYHGFAATSDVTDIHVASGRNNVESFIDYWTADLTLRKTFAQNWNYTLTLGGQYTNKHLPGSEQFGGGNRGRMVPVGGDKGYFVKNELTTPNYSQVENLDAKFYGFVDYAWASDNFDFAYDAGNVDPSSPKANATDAASYGVGTRVSYKDFTVDAYVVNALKWPNVNNITPATANKTEVFFSVNYRW